MAALAMRTVVGVLVSALSHRQGWLSLHEQPLALPGNQGPPTTPTAAVGLTLLSPVMLGPLRLANPTVPHRSGVHPHPLLGWNALGMDRAWDEVPRHQEKSI
jgi:hypothetical protein